MFSNHVTLKSGGYLVINQTEALVAIDVNSGRSTREHNIEDTALRTNCEAADEVARQLRLRDLAGLIVVDFIDMEEGRNNRTVERRMKDALKNDRARIQVGRISHFGLLEMSRQRMRTGVLEGSTVICPHCAGAGTVRSTSSIALHVLRVLEDGLLKNAEFNLTVRTRTSGGALHPEPEARSLARPRKALWRDGDGRCRRHADRHRLPRGRARRTCGSAPIQAEPRRASCGSTACRSSISRMRSQAEEVGEDEAEPSAATRGRRSAKATRVGGAAGGGGAAAANPSGIDADAPQPSDTGLDIDGEASTRGGVMQPLTRTSRTRCGRR